MRFYKISILLISILIFASCAKIDSWTFDNYQIDEVNLNKSKKIILPDIPVLSDQFIKSRLCCRYDFLHQLSFILNRKEKKNLQTAVFYALEKTNDFEVVRWQNKKNHIEGKIRIFFSMPYGTYGYCRFYQNIIRKKQKARLAIFKACKLSEYSPYWQFSSGATVYY